MNTDVGKFGPNHNDHNLGLSFRYQELKPSGVRFIDTANNNKLSNDLEPAYVTVDEETNKAYVVLQVVRNALLSGQHAFSDCLFLF